MEYSESAHDAPRARRGLTARGCALLCLDDPRAAFATMLILQELGLSVDLVAEPEAAVRWLRQARYELVVLGGGGALLGSLTRWLREAAPGARFVVLADERDAGNLAGLDDLEGVEVLLPPLDVNALMRSLWPAP